MSLTEKLEALLSHLNAEENDLALDFKSKLQDYIQNAEDNALWRQCLENGGVDNWSWYSESLQEGGYLDSTEDED